MEAPLIDEETLAALSVFLRSLVEHAAIQKLERFVKHVSVDVLLDMLDALSRDFGEEQAA